MVPSLDHTGADGHCISGQFVCGCDCVVQARFQAGRRIRQREHRTHSAALRAGIGENTQQGICATGALCPQIGGTTLGCSQENHMPC